MLKHLNIDKDIATGIMFVARPDEKADKLLDWIADNQEGLMGGAILKKATEL